MSVLEFFLGVTISDCLQFVGIKISARFQFESA